MTRTVSLRDDTARPCDSVWTPAGVTLIEVSLALFLFGTALVGLLAVISQDARALNHNRTMLTGASALHRRVEARRVQRFNDVFADPPNGIADPPGIAVGTCRPFTGDPGYEDLASLPFAEATECAEAFEARLHRLIITTRVFDRAVLPDDPSIWEAQTMLLVHREGINRR